MTLQLWCTHGIVNHRALRVCMCVRQPTNSEHLELCLDVYISPITQSPEYEVQKQRIPLKIEGHSTRLVDNGLTVALNFEAESPVYLLHGYVRSRHSSHPPRCNKPMSPPQLYVARAGTRTDTARWTWLCRTGSSRTRPPTSSSAGYCE